MLLTNNFYAGNPSSLEAIQQGLAVNEEQRQHIFQLKKTLLFEKKKYNDLQSSYISMQKRVKEREEFLKRQGSDSNSELMIL